ncbi:MAG: SpoIIE family protein phosphatase [Salinivirgaceae bacterium]|nr:SpoIIE family protein phosphatase [Salinivirgaceae bacterium]
MYTSILIFYDGDSVDALDMGLTKNTANFLTFLIDDTFYVGSFLQGLHKIAGDTVEQVPNSQILSRESIYSMLPYDKNIILIATATSKFFLFNTKTNSFTPWYLQGEIPKYLDEEGGYLYDGITLSNGNFGFGYVLGGKCSFIEADRNGEVINLMNTQYGLNDESVTVLYQESIKTNEKPLLWLTLNNGIATLDLSSPIKKFDERNGLVGMIVDILEFNNRLYVATMSGLFVSAVDQLGILYFKPVEDIKPGIVWTLAVFTDPATKKEILLAGTHALEGIYEIHGNKARQILANIAEKHIPNLLTKKIFQSKSKPNRVYLGLEEGFTWMDYINGQWKKDAVDYRPNTSGLRDIRSITEDDNGTVWAGSYLNGIYKLENLNNIDYNYKLYPGKQTNPTTQFFNHEKGMPSYCGHFIETINNKAYFATDNGFYTYYSECDSIVLQSIFDSTLNNKHIHRLLETSNGYAYSVAGEEEKYIEIITKNNEGKWIPNRLPFRTMPNATSDALYVKDTILYIGTSTTLYSYNLNDKLTYTRQSEEKESFDILLREVTAGDSTVFAGTFYNYDGEKLKIQLKQPENNQPEIDYRNNSMVFKYSALWYLQTGKTQYSAKLEGYRDAWSAWTTESKSNFTNLSEGYYTFHVKAKNVYGVESLIATYSFHILPPWYRTVYAIIAYIILAIGLVILILKIYTRRLIAEKERLERIVAERTAEVVAQKEEIEEQSEQIVLQNEHIKSSITYASKIQNAVLPPPEVAKRMFGEHFILYLPRDIVSGDFYWMAEIDGLRYCAVADCTGHGVPGGFMSMMGISFLNQIIGQEKTLNAAEILFQLRENIIQSLHQTGKIGENKDGMDIALYIVDPKTNLLQFSGANNPLVLIRDDEAVVYKADKMPIGIYVKGNIPFTNNEIELMDGDAIYTFSDGYVDQFGGPNKRKFMSKQFRELLLEIHKNPMEEQHDILDKTLSDWHGELDRVDDVVVMGYRHKFNVKN